MKTFYAELDNHYEIKHGDKDAGTYDQNVGEHGNIDLYRFFTKKERDIFVDKNRGANSILCSSAKIEHKERFNYWKNDKKYLTL